MLWTATAAETGAGVTHRVSTFHICFPLGVSRCQISKKKNVMSEELFLGSHLRSLCGSSHSRVHKNSEAVTYTGQWSHNNLSPSDSDVTIIKGFVAQRQN